MASEDEMKIVIHRLESMPSNIELAIGNFGSFSRKKLIEHVKEKDEIGELVVDIYMNQLRAYKDLQEVISRE